MIIKGYLLIRAIIIDIPIYQVCEICKYVKRGEGFSFVMHVLK